MKDPYVLEVLKELKDATKESREGVIYCLERSTNRIDKQMLGILRTLRHLGCFEKFEFGKIESYHEDGSCLRFTVSDKWPEISDQLLRS